MKKNIKPIMKDLQNFSDDRGVFVPVLQNTLELEERGIKIKRVYYIYNYGKGVIRGLHYHKKEWKYFTIVSGAAKFIAINPDNPKEKYEFISSARKPTLVIIPPFFANGWISLEDNTILVCGSSSTLEESLKDDKRYDSNTWGDLWKVIPR
jgi:dTDP-4-dehydrorhamnose 3,5-epimerase-like enzyme